MKKKLPKVFVNSINKKLLNNKKVYYSYKEPIIKKEYSKDTVEEKILKIFNSPNYVYKATVSIKLKKGVVTKQIVGRNKYNLITIDNELIKISDILDINFS